jgi:FXSXX-COOH protein
MAKPEPDIVTLMPLVEDVPLDELAADDDGTALAAVLRRIVREAAARPDDALTAFDSSL